VTKVGDWVIGGQVFSVTAATAFATVYATSQPQAGDCVGLRYTQSAGVRQVVTIFPASCTEAPPTEGLFEAAGPVDAWPGSATFGAWTIGGVAYDARDAVVGPPAFPAATFQQEFGNLGIGVCALVHYRLDGTTRVAVRIESKPDFRCTRSAEEHEFYGLIKTLSTTTGQLGLWEIGALKVMVTQDTRLSGAPFFIGQLVEVKFQRAGDGTLLATSIEGKGRSGNEEHQRGRGKAFGVIGTLPANGVIGSWSIGGTTYNVTDGTRIADGYTPAVNDCVEVYFQVIANVRTAAKIQLAAGDCTGNAEEIGRAYGTVTSMPESGYVGNWTVAGVDYTATGATEFEAEHGPLAMGAFVELRYVRVGDGRVARSIRTLVPPGAGDNVRAGRLETSGVNSLSGASTAGISTTTWKVSGVTYQVNSDTLLDDTLAALQTGANVQVNAFVDPLTGTLVATQVAASTSTFLPMVER
jgi:hypothetical protein